MKKILLSLFLNLSLECFSAESFDKCSFFQKSWDSYSKELLSLSRQKNFTAQADFKKNLQTQLLEAEDKSSSDKEKNFYFKALLSLELDLELQALSYQKKLETTFKRQEKRLLERKDFFESPSTDKKARLEELLNKQSDEIEAELHALKSQIYLSFASDLKPKKNKDLSQDKDFLLCLDYLILEKNYISTYFEENFLKNLSMKDLKVFFIRIEKKLIESKEDLPS